MSFEYIVDWPHYFRVLIFEIGLCGVALSLLIGVAGELGRKMFGDNKRFFFQISFVLALYIAVAIYHLGLHTHAVVWFPLFLFGIWVLAKSNKPSNSMRTDFLRIFRPMLFFLVFFIFNSFLFLDLATGLPKPLYADFYWVGQIAQQLANGKPENTLLELTVLVPEAAQSASPYHYPYLWITILFSKLTGYSTTNTLYLGTLPLLSSLIAEGLYEVLRKYFSLFKTLIIIIIYMFLGPFDWFGFIDVNDLSWSNKSAPLGLLSGKLLLPLGMLLLYFIHSKHKYSVVILAGLPLLSVLFLPPVAGCLFFYFLWKFLISRQYKAQIPNFIAISSTLAGYILFYFFEGFISPEIEPQVPLQINPGLSVINLYKEFKILIGNYFAYQIKIPAISLFGLVLGLMPFLLASFFYWPRKIPLFIGFVLFSFLVSSFLYGRNINNLQFYSAFSAILWAGAVLSIPKMPIKIQYVTLSVFLLFSVRTVSNFFDLRNNNSKNLIASPGDYANLNQEFTGNKKTALFLMPPEQHGFIFQIWRTQADIIYLQHFNASLWVWILCNPGDFPYNHWDSISSESAYRKKSLPTAYYYSDEKGSLRELVKMAMDHSIQNYYFQSTDLYSPYEKFVESNFSFKSIPLGIGTFISIKSINNKITG